MIKIDATKMFKEVATKKEPEIAKNATANVQTEDDNLG